MKSLLGMAALTLFGLTKNSEINGSELVSSIKDDVNSLKSSFLDSFHQNKGIDLEEEE